MEKERKVKIKRKTKETDIEISLSLDGKGKADIKIPLAFLRHMLELFTAFSLFDLKIRAKGDLEVDEHHLTEDLGIVLGEAINNALGEKRGINRFSFALLPMDETLVRIALDISGRPCLLFNVPSIKGKRGSFGTRMTREFLKGFVNKAGLTLHIDLLSGDDLHHIQEAIFKGLGVALGNAVSFNPKRKGIPSTKGRI